LAFSLAVLMAPIWVVLRCTWGCFHIDIFQRRSF